MPTVDQAIALFLQHCRVRNLSAATLRRYGIDLYAWSAWRAARASRAPLASVSLEELRTYLDYLLHEHVPHSANPRRPADDHPGCTPETVEGVRKRLHAAWMFWGDEGLLTDAQRAYFVRGRIPVPKVPLQIRPTYPPELLMALLAATAQAQVPESAARDQAILRILSDTGMRVAELCSLDDGHINHSLCQAVVNGKGGKQRFVFWTAETEQALSAYLAVRWGPVGGPLFRSCGRGGVAVKGRGERLTTGAVRDMFARLAKRAERSLPASAPVHALRHTFAHRFLDEGGDGLHLQQLLGHASMETTQRYVRENPTGLRRIYHRIFGA